MSQETGALLRRRGVDWRYEVTATTGRLPMVTARLPDRRCRRFPAECRHRSCRRCAPAGCYTSGAIRDGIAGCSPDVSNREEMPRFLMSPITPRGGIPDGRLKMLPKRGRVLAVIGMLHDKDTPQC